MVIPDEEERTEMLIVWSKENLYFHHYRFLNVSNLTFFTRKIKYQIQLPHCLHNDEDIMRISILFEHLQKCFHCLHVQQNSQAI